MAFEAKVHFTLVRPGIAGDNYFPEIPPSAQITEIVVPCRPLKDGNPLIAFSPPVNIGEGIFARVEVTPRSACVILLDPVTKEIVASTELENDPTATMWVPSAASRRNRQPGTAPQLVYVGELAVI